jgi:hypothetical protein
LRHGKIVSASGQGPGGLTCRRPVALPDYEWDGKRNWSTGQDRRESADPAFQSNDGSLSRRLALIVPVASVGSGKRHARSRGGVANAAMSRAARRRRVGSVLLHWPADVAIGEAVVVLRQNAALIFGVYVRSLGMPLSGAGRSTLRFCATSRRGTETELRLAVGICRYRGFSPRSGMTAAFTSSRKRRTGTSPNR